MSTATTRQAFVFDRDFEVIANQNLDLDNLFQLEMDSDQTSAEDEWIASEGRPAFTEEDRSLRRLLRYGKRPEQTPRYKTPFRENAKIKRLIDFN